jgi:hypothetical protein
MTVLNLENQEKIRKAEVQALLEKEQVPKFLWTLTEGAQDVEVIHRRRDPILIVDGEVIAFWSE